MNGIFRHITLMAALMFMMGTALAGVYRWVDDQGRVHYGDKPPPGAEPVDAHIPLLDGPAQKPEPDAGSAKAGCQKAREELARYEEADQLMRETEDGAQVELTAAEREEYLSLHRGRVRGLCGGADEAAF